MDKKVQNNRNLKSFEDFEQVSMLFFFVGWYPLPLVKEYTRCEEHQEESHIEADQNVFHC